MSALWQQSGLYFNLSTKRIGKSIALPILYMKATGKNQQAVHTIILPIIQNMNTC
jgi:hypothetical protein